MEHYTHHAEATAIIPAAPDRVFARLDDLALLGSHMEKPSMMMMGGKMTYELDDAQGRAVGSVIRMYVRLARAEERETRVRFGAEFDRYAQNVPAFFPRLGKAAQQDR